MKRSWVTTTRPPSNSASLSSSTSSVGRQHAGQHVQQRRLAAAVGADQPHARARRDDEVEIADEPPAAERLAHAAGSQQPARAALRGGEVDARRAAGGPGAAVLQLL